MRSLAFPLAVLIVVAAALTVVALAQWCRWMVVAGGAVGIAGLVLTGLAVANLGMARSCDGDAGPQVNRPALLLAVGDGDCRRSSALQAGLVALVGAGASVATLRRSRRGDGGAVPAVQLP